MHARSTICVVAIKIILNVFQFDCTCKTEQKRRNVHFLSFQFVEFNFKYNNFANAK